MTKICIHQAADKIGGNCVEIVANNGRRLLLDAGRPLELKKKQQASAPASLDLESPIEGLVLSHSHADHCGLLAELPADWPLICGADTAIMLRFSQDFQKNKRQPLTWERKNKPALIEAGPFRIEAFNIDHSAFDAYAIFIEVDDRRIFYSGDFRGHGRKAALTDMLLKDPPKGIDVMIMEGTNLRPSGEGGEMPRTEDDLQKDFEAVFRETRGRVFVSWAAGNIDRMVTLFKASLKTGRHLAIDLYTALIWEAMGRFARLPALEPKTGIRVVATSGLNNRLMKLGFDNPARHFIESKVAIPARALEENTAKWVVMARNGLTKSGYAGRVFPTAEDAWVWSQWKGYLEDKEQTGELIKFLAPCGEPRFIHSSGHANPELLRALAQAVKPRRLLPIHGQAWREHQAAFENLQILKNGQWLEI